jgi:hypothetical protein
MPLNMPIRTLSHSSRHAIDAAPYAPIGPNGRAGGVSNNCQVRSKTIGCSVHSHVLEHEHAVIIYEVRSRDRDNLIQVSLASALYRATGCMKSCEQDRFLVIRSYIIEK